MVMSLRLTSLQCRNVAAKIRALRRILLLVTIMQGLVRLWGDKCITYVTAALQLRACGSYQPHCSAVCPGEVIYMILSSGCLKCLK